MSQTQSKAKDMQPSALPGESAASAALACNLPRLSLTEFLDIRTLQELQDSFSAVTRVRTSIRDAAGRPVTMPTDTLGQARSNAVLDHLIAPETLQDDQALVAPIIVEGQELGSITIECLGPDCANPVEYNALREFCVKLGLHAAQAAALVESAQRAFAPKNSAVVQTVFLLANHLARLCYQEYQLRERVEELAAINKLSGLLAGAREVQQVLDTAVRTAAAVMNVKAASIRLLNEESRELEVKAVHNLSQNYVGKGPIHLDKSPVATTAFAGEIVYVEDMRSDPRVVYPEDAEREGLVSFLVAGMIYRGRPVGLLQVYSGQRQRFSRFDINLIQSFAQITAAAIVNARLDAQRKENDRVQRQVLLAVDVQRRMLPSAMPKVPPFDIAARYVPSFALGGDFYDFIELEGHLGLAIGDVVGKGIAASLLMASVRASLRAYAQDVYDIDEIMSRVNIALSRDTLTNEFATLFYGVLDPATGRMTYCNAGHEPPLLLRRGEIVQLDVGGTVVGIDQHHRYDKGLVHLQENDLLLLYTDGLCDAQNFNNERFGRPRVHKAMREVAGGSAQDALNHILWEMRRFVGLKHSIDDTTLVVVKITPPPARPARR